MGNYMEKAQEFLKVKNQFKLGHLVTEKPNPKTIGLSDWSKNNLFHAIKVLKEIDTDVISVVNQKLSELELLKSEIDSVFKAGGRVFFCGCGATGRLSLALETIWKQTHSHQKEKDQVLSFMAGGDVALIHSIEKFEDFPEFGERQLVELGFRDGDLLVATTEGGETPFVIGATFAAAKMSKRKPFFLYCNPDDVLIHQIERSKKVIEDENIHKINLTVGPMALSGSTRMQATTILMYFAGLALCFHQNSMSEIQKEVNKLLSTISTTDFRFLKDFIEKESSFYMNNEYTVYRSDNYLGISILTDTTERSPTFSLYPFENEQDTLKHPSLAYLIVANENENQQAWEQLLQRPPRTFLWEGVTNQTSAERLSGFDISETFLNSRKKYLKNECHLFDLNFKDEKINWKLDKLQHSIEVRGLSLLSVHIMTKILLNSLSTLIMGRLDRYESNLMTWVRPSNNKLIDRAVRYAQHLLEQKGIKTNYDELVYSCFELMEGMTRDQSLVLALVNKYS